MFRINQYKMETHLDTHTYNIDELIDIAKEKILDFEPIFEVQLYKETNTCVFSFDTDIRTMYANVQTDNR